MDKTLICFYSLAFIIMLLLMYLFGVLTVRDERTVEEVRPGKNLVRIYTMSTRLKRIIIWTGAAFEVALYAICLGFPAIEWATMAQSMSGYRTTLALVIAGGPIIGVLFALFETLMLEAGTWLMVSRIKAAYAGSRDWSIKVMPAKLFTLLGFIPFGYRIDVIGGIRRYRAAQKASAR